MRVLVTGLDGFTGHYIKPVLENAGHEALDLSCDLVDPDAMNREIARLQPDAVIHLAGISSLDHKNANAFYEVNLIGTRNLLVALADNVKSLHSILLVSSANVYGNLTAGILSENNAPNPCSDYAISKLAMEQMAQLWFDRLPIFIVRPFNYTGVGQSENFLVPKIVAHFRAKLRQIELGNLDVSREFGDVRDVADVYLKLIEAAPVGKILNVCTGHPYPLREVIDCCKQITGHQIDVKVNPEFVRENEIKVLQGNYDALTKVVGGWNPRKLTDTLSWMINASPPDKSASQR